MKQFFNGNAFSAPNAPARPILSTLFLSTLFLSICSLTATNVFAADSGGTKRSSAAAKPVAAKGLETGNVMAKANTKATGPAADLTAGAELKKPVAALSTLGSGDVINMQVYGRPELAITASIDEDGTLAVPLIGPVNVAGLSTAAAAQKLSAAYKSGQFLKNPQITLLVMKSRSQLVSVLGEVRNPGRFSVDSATTVLDLLAEAGGTTERSGSKMYIIRTDSDGGVNRRALDLRGLQDDRYSLKMLTLRGGDSVFVPPAEQFYIYGEVQTPNMYRLEPDMTVLQAISRGGGLTRVASSNRIEIKRRDEAGQLVVRKADLNERLQPDDIIFVKESIF